MICALCEDPGKNGALFFVYQVKGETKELRVVFCDHHADRMEKYLKRYIPASLMRPIR
jgi:hypothetical protein